MLNGFGKKWKHKSMLMLQDKRFMGLWAWKTISLNREIAKLRQKKKRKKKNTTNED